MNRTIRSKNLKLALRAESGLQIGEIYPLSHSRNVIGRRVDAAVPVDDSRVSRNHAAIDVQNGLHFLVDLGSTNGTYLNSRRLEQAAAVSVGDQVRVGSAVFRVDFLDQVKTQAGKAWKEPTRAVLREDVLASKALEDEEVEAEAEEPRSLSESSNERWRGLLPSRTRGLSLSLRRWITFGACGALILAAIATSLTH